jgi:hypothetical protein
LQKAIYLLCTGAAADCAFPTIAGDISTAKMFRSRLRVKRSALLFKPTEERSSLKERVIKASPLRAGNGISQHSGN